MCGIRAPTSRGAATPVSAGASAWVPASAEQQYVSILKSAPRSRLPCPCPVTCAILKPIGLGMNAWQKAADTKSGKRRAHTAAPLIEFSKVVDVAQSAAAGTQNALNRN